MNNPLAPPGGNFKLISEKNRVQDEKCLLDKRSTFIPGGNPCSFPTKAYVISKSDREDRWEKFKNLNADLFKHFEVQRWEASVPKGNITSVVDAIFDSFYQCIKNSQEDPVIIMEDDCYLAEGAVEKIKRAWEDLPGDWDILIGNHYFFGFMEILSDHLSKPLERASTANFIIVRKTIVPKIDQNIEMRRVPSIRDFDNFVTSNQVPINNFTLWPMVSREFSSFSDHKGKILDSAQKIRENSYKYVFIDQEKYYSSLEGW